MSKGKDLVKRGPDGLMPSQREYFQLLAETGSEAEARKKLNLSNRRVARWGREDEAFKRVYDEYSQQVVEQVQTQARMLSGKALETVDDLLNEMKPIRVTVECDECGHKTTTSVQIKDATTRTKMVEMIMKATGILKDRRVVEGEVDVIHMTAGQKLALSLWREGGDKRARVSVQAVAALKNLGLIPEEEEVEDFPRVDDIIEGEATEV